MFIFAHPIVYGRRTYLNCIYLGLYSGGSEIFGVGVEVGVGVGVGVVWIARNIR